MSKRYGFSEHVYDSANLGDRIHAALMLGRRTIVELAAMLKAHPGNVEAAIREMVERGDIQAFDP